MADPHRLMQVLGNLVSNAIKFTSQGFVELRADFIDRTAGVETIRLSVKDTGIGMTPEMQMRLAKPFEQVGANTAGLYGGIGLGMVISRRLTEMMGGELQVQSASQDGTTFSATFKLALSEAVPVEQMHTSSRTSLTSAIQMATPPLSDSALERQLPKTTLATPESAPWVLAVDDNQTNRILIQRQFSLLGLRVRTATDGDQALELWQNGDYALVLTDINMTERNGYELARAIRETEVAQGRPRTPVLGWTANTMSDTLARCKEAGMDDVLIKPADLVRLRELQMRWLPSVPVADDMAKVIEPVDSAFEVEVLDAKLLQESFGNDSSKLRRLLPTIQKTLNEQIAAMNVAIDDRDLAAIKVMSHNMRGSAGLMGAKALMDVCVRLEALVDRGDVSDLGQLTDQFRILAQRTVDVLNSMA
jgi:CheY-like chemotaxis protein